MTRSGLSKLARFVMIAIIAWLCSLSFALGLLVLLMSTGLQASIFGEHFLFELVAISSATTWYLLFSYEIERLWNVHKEQILVDAASTLIIWLLIEAVAFSLSPAFQSDGTNEIGFPHWWALVSALAVVVVVRFRKSIGTSGHHATGLRPTSFSANSANAPQIGSVGRQ